jgi:hypothetical protein
VLNVNQVQLEAKGEDFNCDYDVIGVSRIITGTSRGLQSSIIKGAITYPILGGQDFKLSLNYPLCLVTQQ